MEFSIPIPKSTELFGKFSEKWRDFVAKFRQRRDENGADRISFISHFGEDIIKDARENCPILQSPHAFDWCLSLLEFLENECLFKIVLSFLRYLFFNHSSDETGIEIEIEDFYKEQKLLSALCNFNDADMDILIKYQIISIFQEKGIRELLSEATTLKARDVVEFFSKVTVHGDSRDHREMLQAFIMDSQMQNTPAEKSLCTDKLAVVQLSLVKEVNVPTVMTTDHTYHSPHSDVSNDLKNVEIHPHDFHDESASSSTESSMSMNQEPLDQELSEAISHKALPSAQLAEFSDSESESVMAEVRTIVEETINNSSLVGPSKEEHANNTNRALTLPYDSEQKELLDNGTKSLDKDGYTYKCNFCAFMCRIETEMNTHTFEHHRWLQSVVNTVCTFQPIKEDHSETLEPSGSMSNSSRDHKCLICGMIFGFQEGLYSHYQQHSSMGFAPCSACASVFSTSNLLSDHMSKEHPNECRWSCLQCGTSFSNVRMLRAHCHIHKGQLQDKEGRFACFKCGLFFINRISRLKHVNEFHKAYQTFDDISLTFPCDKCSYVATKRKHLWLHRRVHFYDNSIICDVCDRGFSSHYGLLLHKCINTKGKRFKCQYCCMAFSVSVNRLKHERRHWKEKSHVCKHCGLSFLNLYQLEKHMDIHRNSRPFKCHCGATYGNKTSLRRHERSHTAGTKAYKCDKCDSQFFRIEKLRAHIISKACSSKRISAISILQYKP